MPRVTVPVTLELTDWQAEAVLDWWRAAHPAAEQEIRRAVSVLAQLAARNAVEQLERHLQDQTSFVVSLCFGTPPRLIASASDLLAAWWINATPGQREEFLERISAVKRPGCPLWEIDPLSTTL